MGAAGAAFTNHASKGSSPDSKDSVDAIQFTIDLYLNPQYLPVVISEITKSGFYTSLLVNYEIDPPAANMVGYVYGSQPVVKASLQFEGCYLRSQYDRWMPDVVKTAIADGKAGLNASGSTPGQGGPMPGMPRPDMGPGPGRGFEPPGGRRY
jgi:hypothetical protein